MAKKVCDFCLSEGSGLFNRPEKIAGGHHICSNCRKIIQSYGLPIKYELFQMLVTAQDNMKDMVMDVYLEKNNPDEVLAKYYPLPSILLHEGEHCINAVPATIHVKKEDIPEEPAVKNISEIVKKTIHNIGDAAHRSGAEKVKGILYETEAAVYFLSDNFINCHRLGYLKRNQKETDRVKVVTPTKSFTYYVDHSDMFFYRERFFQKVNAARNNKNTHLIYITNDNEITITPGVYDIPKSIRPGRYEVKAINDAGLHMRDALGRVTDYYANDDAIHLPEGGVLECTGEYQLKWIGKE